MAVIKGRRQEMKGLEGKKGWRWREERKRGREIKTRAMDRGPCASLEDKTVWESLQNGLSSVFVVCGSVTTAGKYL